MRAFDYAAPGSVDEAVSLLSSDGDGARVLAGGTDIITQLGEGRKRADLLVDVKNVAEAREIAHDPQNGLRMGAAVPCCEIYEDEEIQSRYPVLTDSVSLIGSIQIQSRATVGGNLCNASPAADTIPTLIVLRATAEIAGPGGRRDVPVESFCTGPGTTVLNRRDLLLSLRFPIPEDNSGSYFLRFIPRNEMDIAVVNAAASVVLDNVKETILAARIAVGAVAPTPLLVEGAGDVLAGRKIGADALEEAAESAQEASRPITDMRGTAEQRRHLTRILTRRALEGAIRRARAS